MKKITAAILLGLFIAQPALALEFNPNYIISDSEILDKSTMSLNDIKSFLSEKGGSLANRAIENYDNILKSAAEIIYDAAINNYDCDDINLSDNPTIAERKAKCVPISINPRFLLVLLQKEQSLLDEKNPKQSQLDWAAGYGCPDGGGCNPKYQGFGKQVNSASLQFYEYMANHFIYKYQAGKTYVAKNKYDALIPITEADQETLNSPEKITVTPQNKATASLYTYTPHVYNGNYNFWKLWNQYFSRIFPDGSLVRADSEPGVWLIQGGKKRPFLSQGALNSRYDPKKIITVNKADLDGYLKGDPIKFAQYSLVKSPPGDIYLLVNDAKRKIESPEAFRRLGFNPEEVDSASSQDLSYYQNGDPVTENDAYPTGVLLKDPKTGGVYFVINGAKAPLIDPIFLKTKFKNYSAIKATEEELEKYTKIEPVKFEDGYLLKSTMNPSVYVISNGVKRPIASGKVFENLGYKWENILEVHPRVLALYGQGEIITEESLSRD